MSAVGGIGVADEVNPKERAFCTDSDRRADDHSNLERPIMAFALARC